MIKKSKRFKELIARFLVLSALVSFAPGTTIKANAAINLNRQEQGSILHAWNWSFNTIKDNLDDIQKAGYTSIQVSPIQRNKDDSLKEVSKWWILYQPINFHIGNAQLGTKDEFQAMCEAAEAKGIKVIVDVIVNHTGNRGDGDNAFYAPDNVDASIRENEDFWHQPHKGVSNWDDRYEVTHYGVGLPDLNTSNKELQKMARDYLKECLDAGADGFRFDTAKHVELPKEDDGDKVGSDFWSTVLDDLKTKEGNDPFIYGEVLQGGADNFSKYSKYMNLTTSNFGHEIRSLITSGSPDVSKIENYEADGVSPEKLVTWVESHDTYANDSKESTGLTLEQRKNGWALIAARKDATPLYFNRPAGRTQLGGNMGDAGSDDWKDADVVAVNKFRNAMIGKDEKLTEITSSIMMIERYEAKGDEDNGAVIVNLGDDADIDADTNLKDGTYTNCATAAGDFTVSNGKITGKLSKGITVLYKAGTKEQAVASPKVLASKENSSFTDTLELTLSAENTSNATYSINGGAKTSYTNGEKITIGNGAAAGEKITVALEASNADNTRNAKEKYFYIKKDSNSVATVYFKKPADWKAPYVYAHNELGEKNSDWPGIKMTKIGNDLYKYELKAFTDSKVKFNDWFFGNHQSQEVDLKAIDMKVYDGADNTWKTTTALAEDSNVTPDEETKGTSKVYLQKPEGWDDDIHVYFYGKGGPSWPGVKMEKVEGKEGLYTYTLPAGLEDSMVLFNAKGGSVQVPKDTGFKAPANSTMIYDNGWKEYVKGNSKAYFRKPADWSEPKAYVWKDSTKNAEWPGIAMEKVAGTETLYSYTLPDTFKDCQIIFTDGSNKTKDLSIPFETSKMYDEKTEALRDFTASDLKEPEVEPVQDEDVKGVTKVYFKNEFGWKDVKVYTFNPGTSDSVHGWPGVSAKSEGNDLYSYTLPKGFENATVIFNNNDGEQTQDLATKLGSTMKFVSEGKDGNKIKGTLESMTKVYFKNNQGWEGVKIHYWQTTAGGASTNWPGKSVVDEGNNLYSYTLPEGYENAGVIFNNNNNGQQTKDLAVTDGQTLIFIADKKDDKGHLDGEWREFTKEDIPASNNQDPDEGEDSDTDNGQEPQKEVSKAPTVNGQITSNRTTITGKAGKNAKITLSVEKEVIDTIDQDSTTGAAAKVETKKIIDQVIGETTADENGNWSVKIDAQKVGTKIKVTAKEENKEESEIEVSVIKRSSSSSSSTKKSSSTTTTTTSNSSSDKVSASTVNKAIESSTSKDVKVEVNAKESKVEKDVFELLAKNPTKNLVLAGDNYSWTFAGADIVNNAVVPSNIDTTVSTVSPNVEEINKITSGKAVVNVYFSYHGALPGKAKVKVKVDPKYNGKTMLMYHFNNISKRLELTSSNVQVQNGEATFEITHCSDYILSETEIAGAVKQGWNKNADGTWSFLKADFTNSLGWVNDNGTWYYMNPSGIMKTGWVSDNGTWYYLKSSGAMATGWVNDNSKWYYLNQSGAMLANTTIEGYTLSSNGEWIA